MNRTYRSFDFYSAEYNTSPVELQPFNVVIDHENVALELLAAVQGIEFHRPAQSSVALEAAIAAVRGISPPYTEDRSLAGDINGVAALIAAGGFRDYADAAFSG